MNNTRTVALLGHRHAGKTSLGDRLLEAAGAVRAAGRVDDGTSLLDHEPEDKRHRATAWGGIAWLDWREHRVHLVDTPGAEGLFHEQVLAMALVDAGVVVVSAPHGLQHGAERVLVEAARTGLPCLVVVTHVDRAWDLPGLLAAIEAASETKAALLAPPPGADPDLAREHADRLAEAVAVADDALAARYLEEDGLPEDVVRAGLAAAVRARTVIPVVLACNATGEGAAAVLDAIVDALPSPATRRPPRAVDSETGEDVEIQPSGPFAAQLLAVRLDEHGAPYRVLRVFGAEMPRRALVHAESGAVSKISKLYALRGPRTSLAKDTGPGAIVATWDPLPGRPGDTFTDGHRYVLGAPPWPAAQTEVRLLPAGPQGKLDAALATLETLDSAVDVGRCELTGVPLLGVAGQDHLDRVLDLLRTRLGAAFTVEPPLVPYMEVPETPVMGVEGVHERKHANDVQEFAKVVVSIAPCEPDDPGGLELHCDPERLPPKFHAAVAEGVARAARRGPQGGYAVASLRVRVEDGDYDMFVTTDAHVAAAAENATRAALALASSFLVEPWWRVEIRVPPDLIGDVLTEVSARRGRVGGLEVDGREATLFADCPQRELRTVGAKLASITAARGRYTGRLVRYDRLPEAFVRDALQASPFRND